VLADQTEALRQLANQLSHWARQNRRKRDQEPNQPMRTVYGYLAVEQDNYAALLRMIARGEYERAGGNVDGR